MNLQQGDCLDLIQDIPDASVDAVICDAPYFQGLTHNGQKGGFGDLSTCKPFFQELFQQFDRVCKPRRCVYFFTDWRGYAFYFPIFNNVFQARNAIVWAKKGGAGSYYTYTHEFIIFHCETSRRIKGGANVLTGIKPFCGGAKKTNGEKVHPTQKPVELMEKLILDSTQPGMTVIDPMMGSGTTGVACVNTGRHFIGFELDEQYFEIAKKRIDRSKARF